ncbi:uncharacterized protein LOC123560159 [Mercenaria mercenaria]|uniref:uncharacterized protein LOC123560159 n=1 Tax=Mercenaria mercenaria TaxID=6596 RepID=UPI00234F16AD|nr:uncharacterized protein LOC123560159 [Mercenaria mercenaria]XP_053372583.1 uncharacterized protein LOC123560159 [Mercenaria mercenaria]
MSLEEENDSLLEEKMSLEEENDSLLEEVFELLEGPDCDNPEVILLIGRSGAGKSSLVNTLHMVLTGRFYMIAKQGSGQAQTVTLDLLRYNNCGVILHRISDTSTRERMTNLLPRLPHILDCAGLADENTPKLREIIELLIGGYIRPGTSIDALEKKQEECGIGRLKEVFKPDPAWKVSKIVFMQGCIDDIPKNLIQCLREVLKISNSATLTRKYQCEVFVLITKYDLVNKSSDLSLDGNGTENSISADQFEKAETEIAEAFCNVGAIGYNTLRWVSFTDNVGFSESQIRNRALKFLKKMIEPGVPKMPEPTFFDRLEEYVYQTLHKLRRAINRQLRERHFNCVSIIGCLFLSFVFIYVMYCLLRASV